jgi:hypothetical protein
MIKCVASEKGILFIREDGSIKAFKVDELCPSGELSELRGALYREVFPLYPGFEEAWDGRTIADVFCSVDGHWEWDYQDGRLVCAECGEPPYGEFEGLLIPSAVFDALKEARHAGEEEPAEPARPDRGERPDPDDTGD